MERVSITIFAVISVVTVVCFLGEIVLLNRSAHDGGDRNQGQDGQSSESEHLGYYLDERGIA